MFRSILCPKIFTLVKKNVICLGLLSDFCSEVFYDSVLKL